tara:strand:+ start:797 stop:1237 length:441 start_codon:yes stop_codon:yes gene_type:complete
LGLKLPGIFYQQPQFPESGVIRGFQKGILNRYRHSISENYSSGWWSSPFWFHRQPEQRLPQADKKEISSNLKGLIYFKSRVLSASSNRNLSILAGFRNGLEVWGFFLFPEVNFQMRKPAKLRVSKPLQMTTAVMMIAGVSRSLWTS